jgi:hypothetical protein
LSPCKNGGKMVGEENIEGGEGRRGEGEYREGQQERIATIGFDISQFHVSIIFNLVFLFITYLLLLDDFSKNGSKYFLDFYFFKGFSTQFLNITLNNSTPHSAKVLSQDDSKFVDPLL